MQAPRKPDPSTISFKKAPKPPGPELWVQRLGANQSFEVIAIGNEVRGVETHWMRGVTEPHYDDRAQCPGCLAQARLDWKGYLHVYNVQKREQVFMELTPGAYHHLRTQVSDIEQLRGLSFQVERKGARNQPIKFTLLHTRPLKTNLPPEKDPMPSILKLWGIWASGEQLEPVAPAGEPPGDDLSPPPDCL